MRRLSARVSKSEPKEAKGSQNEAKGCQKGTEREPTRTQRLSKLAKVVTKPSLEAFVVVVFLR